MRYGVYAPTFGEYDSRTLADLAADAESAGWDGFFIWDHMVWTPSGTDPLADPTVTLAAIAVGTERIRFGALVTPLARRRPWKVAKETVTLDRLSGGRVVLGVGLGMREDTAPFGEGREPREAAEVLDEALTLVSRFWTGERTTYDGTHFHVDATLLPAAVQQPRIPIWVAGVWPNKRPFRRAARWDGALPEKVGPELHSLTPEELRECHDFVRDHREDDTPFDLIAFAVAEPRTAAAVAEYESAGATWWIDAVNPAHDTVADFRARVRRGPPR